MKVTDEQLSAYIDGELLPEETRALEAQISEDAELAERVRKLRTITDALVSATSDVLDAPVPAHIVDLIKSDAEEQSRNIKHFKRREQKSWFQSPLLSRRPRFWDAPWDLIRPRSNRNRANGNLRGCGRFSVGASSRA